MRESFKNWKKPEILEGKLTKWNWMVQGVKGLVLGDYTDIGVFSYINATYGVTIGNHVELGSHCSVYSVSTIDGKKGAVVIGKNAKIGTHSTIMPGVTIGENSVVGAYSFVNKDIPANEIWVGCPAKYLKGVVEKK